MTDLKLQAILQKMLNDLGDESNHYMLMANYYEHTSTEKANERWYLANIYIHKNAVANVFIDEDSISLGVRLNPDNLYQIDEIKMKVDQIYRIRKNKTGGIFNTEDDIYVELSKLNFPAFN
ncbi:hypothetical protein [Runella limosa]|uniref:hypothetical protein n=1 Tax=Runella limosa TaxID=370978 RepID=UPI00048F1A91|nr:hypothetical protein [Runella limosa]